jgi:hypothetical protein
MIPFRIAALMAFGVALLVFLTRLLAPRRTARDNRAVFRRLSTVSLRVN